MLSLAALFLYVLNEISALWHVVLVVLILTGTVGLMFYVYAVGAAFVVYFPKPKVDTRKSLLSKGEKENFTEVSIALCLNEFQLCLKYYK